MYTETTLHGHVAGLDPSFGSMPTQAAHWPSVAQDSANSEQFWLSWGWSAAEAVPGAMCTSPTLAQRSVSISGIPSPVAAQSNSTFADSCDSNETSPPADIESKKERRRAQNRVAQQAFRERKVQRFRDFQGEVETLNSTISRLECENSDLRSSLRDARTEIEILRSIIPQLTRLSSADQSQTMRSDQDHQLQALLMKLGVNGILRSLATGEVPDK